MNRGIVLLLGLSSRNAEEKKLNGQPLSHWTNLAEKGDDQERLYALGVIERGAASAELALPALTRLLKDPDSQIRAKTAFILFRMGKAAWPAVPALIEATRDPVSEVRAEAATALRKPGLPARKDIVRALLNLLKDVEPGVRANAIRTLGNLKPVDDTARDIVNALYDTDALVRQEACAAMYGMGREAKSAEFELADALNRVKDLKYRRAVLTALAGIGVAATDSVPAVQNLLKDPSPEIRMLAARAHWRCTRDPEKVVPVCIEILNSDKPEQRKQRAAAFGLLASVGSEAKAALPLLIKAMGNPFETNRAGDTLDQLGPPAATEMQSLASLLKSKHQKVRVRVIKLLANYGTAAREVAPSMAALLDGQRADLAPLLLNALSRSGALQDRVLAESIRILKSKQPRPDSSRVEQMGYAVLFSEALSALERLGPKAKPAVPILIDLSTKQGTPGRDIITVFGSIGPGASESVPLLTRLLKDKHKCSSAAEALGAIASRSAIPDLKQALEGHCPAYAAEALWKISKAPEALNTLAELAGSDNPQHYSRAIQALGQAGADAKATEPVLLRQLENKEGWIRAESARALWKISQHENVIPTLIDLFRHDNRTARFIAIEMLGSIGPKAAAVIPELIVLLNNREEDHAHERTIVLKSLARIAPKDERVTKALNEALKDPSMLVYRAAKQILTESRK